MSANREGRTEDGSLALFSDRDDRGLAEGSASLGELVGAQRDAVTYPGARLVVVGGAGTGKTRVIEARFQWLVQRGCQPERIVVATASPARRECLRAHLEGALDRSYEQLLVLTPAELAARVTGAGGVEAAVVLGAEDRLAMLHGRVDELSLRNHDFGGNVNALLGGFIRRIDRLKAELIRAEEFEAWAAALPDSGAGVLEREFAEVFRTHERMLLEANARDAGDLIRDALRLAREQPAMLPRSDHLLLDDAQELDLGAARLVCAVARGGLTVAGDPRHALRRFRGAGDARMRSFCGPGVQVVALERSLRCPDEVARAASALAVRGAAGSGAAASALTVRGAAGSGAAASALTVRGAAGGAVAPCDRRAVGGEAIVCLDPGLAGARGGGTIEFWRCANDRAQAQSIAADVERLIARDGARPGQIVVLVPAISREGQAIAVALEERAVPHALVGEAAFFHRAEIRDLLAWLRLLADCSDAGAVVRALARAPIELRSVDIARCTQIARRRKLDMVAALAAATESPQVPPEARERIRVFLKLYRAGMSTIDTSRPDLYVHRLIERLGLRRQQLFAAQADVVARLRALARFGELASAYVRRAPQATPREFARSIAAVADFGLREQEEPQLSDVAAVQVLELEGSGGLEADHVYVAGLHAGLSVPPCEQIPDALLHERLPTDDEPLRASMLAQQLYVAVGRARRRVVLAFSATDDRGGATPASPPVEELRSALGGGWRDLGEELFGPAETLHSTYRLLRDELLEGTMRAGGRLAELRFDTDLDVTHAVVRYLELLKVAALIARPEGHGVAEALRDVNMRILQAVTAEQREVYTTSALDDYLLDADRDARRRAQAIAARDEPSLEPFLPKRGDGVVLSASDIDTYRTCPLKYKFARVFRIPQEPTVHQRFGILVHQVLERFHARDGAPGPLPELLGLLDAGWRRSGFGDSEEERQLRGKAAAALTRYHARFQSSDAEPVWFERQFTFKLGPHLLRGRVDRVDRLPGGDYELIDYKTGRPKSAGQLAGDVQLSLYAVGAREAWRLEASRQAYYYLLDDQKVAVPATVQGDRAEWIRDVAIEVAEGILAQGFEPTPSITACSVCDYRLLCPAAER